MRRNPITGEELPNGWILVRVDDIKSPEKYSCVAGPFGSDISSQYFQDHGVPVIRGNNLSLEGDKFIADGFVFVSNERAEKYKAQRVKANDLVFTCWGTIGQVGIIPQDGPFKEYIISNKQLKLRADETIVNPLFLYYYFSSKTVLKYLNNIAIGSAVPGINLGILKKFPIPLPPKQVQDKIAFILDEIYRLIENNKQRIKLLEEMAEEIYKEWFVRFRFPGYESTRFFDEKGKEVPHGTPGALPEGWTLTALKNCLKFYIGGGWGEDSPSTTSQEPAYVIRGTDIPCAKVGNPNFQVLRYHTKSNLSNRLLEENDIVFEVSGGTESQSLGRALLMSTELLKRYNQSVICASFCKLIRTDTDVASPFYLYQLLERLYKTGEIMLFQVQSTGISNYKFEEFVSRQKVILPSKLSQEKFENFLKPMIQEIQLLGSKNQLLQKTRDLLLPRLISGKLSVEHLIDQELESLSLAAEPEPVYSK